MRNEMKPDEAHRLLCELRDAMTQLSSALRKLQREANVGQQNSTFQQSQTILERLRDTAPKNN